MVASRYAPKRQYQGGIKEWLRIPVFHDFNYWKKMMCVSKSQLKRLQKMGSSLPSHGRLDFLSTPQVMHNDAVFLENRLTGAWNLPVSGKSILKRPGVQKPRRSRQVYIQHYMRVFSFSPEDKEKPNIDEDATLRCDLCNAEVKCTTCIPGKGEVAPPCLPGRFTISGEYACVQCSAKLFFCKSNRAYMLP